MTKRLFDIVMSLLGLLLLWPLLVCIALWVKLDSAGPVFFRQERIGRFGVPFRIHKFRTMTHGATGIQVSTNNDSRITRAGHWLRAVKLDELPQLIDVLQGTMSFVGPRPEVPRYVAMYSQAMRDKVLSVRPGITDPGSLAYRHEGELLAKAADPEREYINVVMPAKLKLAADYVDHASMRVDLLLILRTLGLVWGRLKS